MLAFSLVSTMACGLEAYPTRQELEQGFRPVVPLLQGDEETGGTPTTPAGQPEGDDRDSDEDGLSNAREAELGTDPNRADSDGDGILDGDEVDLGTSPVNAYSRPYTGGYNVGDCDSPPVATGPTGGRYREGDVAENFTLPDHHGEQVDLYSFCGRTVLLAFGAPWCGPCQSLASHAQQLQDTYGDQGFQIIEILIESGSGGIATEADLVGWADSFGLDTVPVLGVPASGAPWIDYEMDWYIPTTVVLGPDMRVLSVDQGVTDPGGYLP